MQNQQTEQQKTQGKETPAEVVIRFEGGPGTLDRWIAEAMNKTLDKVRPSEGKPL